MSRHKAVKLKLGVALWVGCIAAGFCALQRYATEAGPAHAPRNAEQFFSIHQQPNRPLLVMIIHPRCPCTDASLAELGDLLARSRGACDALLLQYHPEQADSQWHADTSPRRLGGVSVKVQLDPGGKMASALGAATSGHVVFADAHGVLRFAGGITVSRGHRGRAPAQDAILDVLAGRQTALSSAPVYGCALEPECSACSSPRA
jgi:hypothetical protein